MAAEAPGEPELGPITNGDTWHYEAKTTDTPAVAALKADWRAVADEEQVECRARDSAERAADVWTGKALAARRRVDQIRARRAKIQNALAALR